jgi:hypothetical protein
MSIGREYYEAVVRGYRRVDDAEIIDEFFIGTEPEEEQPKHSRIMSTEAAETAVAEFFSKLTELVMKNTSKEWDGKNLFAHDKELQPLGWDDEKENI